MSPEKDFLISETEQEPSPTTLVDSIGGKAVNLLILREISEKIGFIVPEFKVIPVGAEYTERQLKDLFDSMPKPLVVRSSSPWEDSSGHSFAGKFKSVLSIWSFPSFQAAVQGVIASAKDPKVDQYAQQHGLLIDDRMAVIVQEMVDPDYSGACYSTLDPDNPTTVVEFTFGLSDGLMAGTTQGYLCCLDQDFNLVMEYGDTMPYLKEIARVAREIEGHFGERLDIEFAISMDEKVHIVQARPITDAAWPKIQIPEIDDSRVCFQADIVRGSGSFTGEVFVFRSIMEMVRYARSRNKQSVAEFENQAHKLGEFNRRHPEGYCLLLDVLETHEILMENIGVSNMRVLITVDFASRFSHPLKVITETGAFYLGVLGRKDLLDALETGDRITVVSDQSKGIVFDRVRPAVKKERINLEAIPAVWYETALEMRLPSYEQVDDRLFLDREQRFGVIFWDYDEEDGVPSDVYYSLVDTEGNIIANDEYHATEARFSFPTFFLLLTSLFVQAKKISGKT